MFDHNIKFYTVPLTAVMNTKQPFHDTTWMFAIFLCSYIIGGLLKFSCNRRCSATSLAYCNLPADITWILLLHMAILVTENNKIILTN